MPFSSHIFVTNAFIDNYVFLSVLNIVMGQWLGVKFFWKSAFSLVSIPRVQLPIIRLSYSSWTLFGPTARKTAVWPLYFLYPFFRHYLIHEFMAKASALKVVDIVPIGFEIEWFGLIFPISVPIVRIVSPHDHYYGYKEILFKIYNCKSFVAYHFL